MSRADGKRLTFVRLVAAASFGIVAVPAVAIASGGAMFGDLDPSLALRFNPWNARAYAHLGVTELTGAPDDAAARARATAAARNSLSRDPTLAFAWSTLGLTSGQQAEEKAAPFFAVSERLSRRDFPTRLWLIERQVEQGNVSGALHHYDIALRTNSDSYDMLLPILVAAAGDRQVLPELGRLLAKQPRWTNNFFYRLSQSPPSDQNVAELLENARKGGALSNPEMLRAMLPGMIDRGAYDPALRVAAALDAPAARLPKGVWNPSFAGDGSLAPLDWSLTSTEALGAEVRTAANRQGRALVAYANANNAGTVARQILMLSPGTYRLAAEVRATDRPPAVLSWSVVCAGSSKVTLAEQSVEPLGEGATRNARFSVPAGCLAQWLSFSIEARDPQGGEAAIDRVTVAKVDSTLTR